MFCGSTAYGTGCPYSPHKKHVHVSSGNKCIYCGSTATGTGCPHDPFSKVHVRGADYNSMTKESVYRSVIAGIFLQRLVQPLTETSAYKLGLIDEKGCKIKDGETIAEKAALTPLDMHIFKIRRMISEDILDLFKSSILLEIASDQKEDKFDATKYQSEVKLISSIDHTVNSLYELFSEGVEKGFSRSHIENLIIESILKKYEDSKN
jgi:hypothetical protein